MSDTRSLADSGPVYQAFVSRCDRTQRECKRLIGTNWAFAGKSATNWARDLNTSSYPTRRQCQVHKAQTNDSMIVLFDCQPCAVCVHSMPDRNVKNMIGHDGS